MLKNCDKSAAKHSIEKPFLLSLISRGKTGHWVLSPPMFEKLLIFPNLLRYVVDGRLKSSILGIMFRFTCGKSDLY